jgi:hypothetical protein
VLSTTENAYKRDLPVREGKPDDLGELDQELVRTVEHAIGRAHADSTGGDAARGHSRGRVGAAGGIGHHRVHLGVAHRTGARFIRPMRAWLVQ